jgi:hypothetical protein
LQIGQEKAEGFGYGKKRDPKAKNRKIKGWIMKTAKTNRGFRLIVEEKYQNEPDEFTRLIQESSAVGSYDDSFDNPGSSYLWIGNDHHLNREQAVELIEHLQYWIENKRLKEES